MDDPQYIDADVEPDAYDVVLQVNDAQVLKLFSALNNGAYITYPEEWHNVVWWLWRALDADPPGGDSDMEFAIVRMVFPAGTNPPPMTASQWNDIALNVAQVQSGATWFELLGGTTTIRLQPGQYFLFGFMQAGVDAVNAAALRFFNITTSAAPFEATLNWEFEGGTLLNTGIIAPTVQNDLKLQLYTSRAGAPSAGNVVSNASFANVVIARLGDAV